MGYRYLSKNCDITSNKLFLIVQITIIVIIINKIFLSRDMQVKHGIVLFHQMEYMLFLVDLIKLLDFMNEH